MLQRGQLQETIPYEQRQSIYTELLILREQILEGCEQPWSIEKMCKILNIGKSQLYKYYNFFFHCTPKEELIKARLQKARYLMSNEALTIKQAAYNSGFQNINHFNRLFKEKYNCTPSEYRKN
jgi:AraC-like DNA-binding protein